MLRVAEIRRLLEADGADFREYVSRRTLVRRGCNSEKEPYDDLVTFYIKNSELAEWLNLHHKRLPMAYVTTWPEAQARALFNALIDGDGHRRHHNGLSFYQQREDVADAVQVLAIRLGYRAGKYWQPSSGGWQISMSDSPVQDRRWTQIRKWGPGEPGLRRETYTGTVWCPMVETSFWLARRNGKTFITGNSDKFRPACSYWAVACTGRRWFDLDAVRHIPTSRTGQGTGMERSWPNNGGRNRHVLDGSNPGGAPPLDWLEDDDELDQFERDLWTLPTSPYPGSHYATFSPELIRRFIVSMCPARVCRACGKPSVRLTSSERIAPKDDRQRKAKAAEYRTNGHDHPPELGWQMKRETLGWSDCGHGGDWRPGLVLDPFGGSGTTGMVAAGNGRDALLFDLDERCEGLARERIGLYLAEQSRPEPQAEPTHEQGAIF